MQLSGERSVMASAACLNQLMNNGSAHDATNAVQHQRQETLGMEALASPTPSSIPAKAKIHAG